MYIHLSVIIKSPETDLSSDHSHQDVIVSAGTFDTPKLLLLSGVGPVKELQKHNIPIVTNLPGSGSNMRDHCFAPLRISLKPDTLLFPPPTPEQIRKNEERWFKDRGGPLGTDDGAVAMGYFKVDSAITCPEFLALDEHVRSLIGGNSMPNYETLIVSSPLFESIPSIPPFILNIGSYQTPNQTNQHVFRKLYHIQQVNPRFKSLFS